MSIIPLHLQREQALSLLTAFREVFTPKKVLKPSQWAEEYRHTSPEVMSKRSGRWRNFPMQVEPMDSILEPEVQSTCLVWAAQTAGKTEILNNIVGWGMHQDPGPMLYIQPTLILAETVSKDRVKTMIRDTPVLKAMPKGRGSTILHMTFPGGQLTFAGADSPASLSGRPIRGALFDEVDRYPITAGKEGDPIALGERRQESYHELAFKFKTSTPTIAGHSRIEKEFEFSDKRYWFINCPHCLHEQTLKWKNVRWPTNTPELAYYVCDNEGCGAQWNDQERVAAVKAGRWLATAPFSGIRGYHLNGIYSLMKPLKGFKTKLHQMAADFLKAKKLGKETLKVWTNTFLAETWSEEDITKPSWKVLDARKEDYLASGMIPKGVRILTAGLDFQADRVECEIRGWGMGEESWGILHSKMYGDPRNPLIYGEIDGLLNREFVREDRARLKVLSAGFDTGHAASQSMLYTYLRPRLGRGFYGFKGAAQRNAEPISHSDKSRVKAIKLLMVGTNRIKAYIYNRVTIKEPGPGYIHIPSSYTSEWCQQLLAENFSSVYEAGHKFYVFKMPEGSLDEGETDRNEALDLMVYAQAALYARGAPNWEYLEKINLGTIPPDEEEDRKRLIPLMVQAPIPILKADMSTPIPYNRIRRVKTRKGQHSGLLTGLLR